MILPCQDFCNEFMNSCANILPGELRDRIKCSVLKTEADGPGACISKPGCVAEMRNLGKSQQICDGVVDCPDFSDELYCPYCPEHHFHCGVGQMCVPKNQMCDGTADCDNGADEKGCRKSIHQTIRKVKFLPKNSILTKLYNFLGKSKLSTPKKV